MSGTLLKNFSTEDKAKYRDQKILTAFDRRTLAANIIQKDYDCRNPHSRMSVRDGICSCGKPITHGDIFLRLDDNGPHAHIHAIWIFDTPEDPIHLIPAIGGEVLKRWDALVYKETHRHINQHHGFNLEYMELGDPQDPNAAHIAKYAAKSISIYCSDGDKDKGSSTPFDLLNSSSTAEDHARYLDFYKGQKAILCSLVVFVLV